MMMGASMWVVSEGDGVSEGDTSMPRVRTYAN